jgi:hypothetical protein
VLAGSGLRIFDDGATELPLRLPASTPFAAGMIHLVYGPDSNPPTGGHEEARESLPQEWRSGRSAPAPELPPTMSPCGRRPGSLLASGGRAVA